MKKREQASEDWEFRKGYAIEGTMRIQDLKARKAHLCDASEHRQQDQAEVELNEMVDRPSVHPPKTPMKNAGILRRKG